ncbi:MAG TPA: FAD-dependent oxidoreductase, partial [Phycisphaerae bacterium]|nr:FAD-dependent oxidoreductase [Phycisphaerae bacterium]
HVALGSIRVMVPCLGMGEAAGTAAALSLAGNVTPRALDVATLQARLREQGGILSEADIEHAAEADQAPAAVRR